MVVCRYELDTVQVQKVQKQQLSGFVKKAGLYGGLSVVPAVCTYNR